MKLRITKLYYWLILISLLFSKTSKGDIDPTELPLFTIDQLEYLGAFRLPANQLGESNANWANGTIAYNHRNDSLFFVGHNQHQAIAEFKIPELVKTNDIRKLNFAIPIQNFSRIFNRLIDNPDGQDRITGAYYNYNRLIINTIKYYDASASARNTTLVIKDASQISQIKNLEFFQLDHAARSAGWISPIPNEWRNALNSDVIIGNGSGRPINSRLSIGPSAYGTNIRKIINADLTSKIINTIPFQYYTLSNPLVADLNNSNLENLLLTHLSEPVYGFIIPGTRTYMTFGRTGGHKSGVGYKLKIKELDYCPGFCPNDPNDLDNYYWLWDINDWLKVIKNEKSPHDIRPYAFGSFPVPFITKEFRAITGGTLNTLENTLWITLDRADTYAGPYNNPPIILSYSLSQRKL